MKALTNDSKNNYLLKTQTIWLECSPPVSTYSIQLDVTYSPSLDSFHISHSKCWGIDVDKVGSCHIFSYTDIVQDPCGKACVQCVHSAAVSFRHVSCSRRILCNTPLYTCGPPCSRHSFWYKAWYTGTANRPFFLYSTLRGLILSDS